MPMSIQKIKDELKNQLEGALEFSQNLEDTDNLLGVGLESLTIMRLLSDWMKKGYKVSFGNFFKTPTIQGWAELLFGADISKIIQSSTEIINDKEPFDLTDIQYAYWIGRSEGQYLGGVGCHGYLEVNAQDIDMERLNSSWKMILRVHPMLRSCFTEDGKQFIMEHPYSNYVSLNDLRECSNEEREYYLENHRECLSHRLLKIEKGQVTDLQVTQLTDHEFVLHFDIDLLICDVQSFQIILRDLARYYLYGIEPEVSPDWNFAQYLHNMKLKEAGARETARKFWEKKLPTLPDGPNLPVNKNLENIQHPKFIRNTFEFSAQEWRQFKSICASYGITPAMAMLTAYARIIAKWSENKQFLLNLPMFNRDTATEIENVVADFTSLLLVEMDFSEERSFLEDAVAVQKQFHENVGHIKYSGIQVLRDLQKYKGKEAMAPVVFSCNIGSPLLSDEFIEAFGDISYMISQTPQVWLDFQAFNTTGGLLVIWDSVEQVFPTGMLAQMFQVFIEQMHQIIELGFETNVCPLSSGERRRKKAIREVKNYKPQRETLHYDFFRWANRTPNAPAIINGDSKISLSYGTVSNMARSISAGIYEKGQKKQLIGILTERGEKQIISALGILGAGMAFVPLSVTQPMKRLSDMVRKNAIQYVIVDESNVENFAELATELLVYEELLDKTPLERIPKVEGADIAYVIFTSGTTGLPKGVEIEHSASANTVADINQKCMISASDIFFNVSSFDFDLSIYDVFGSLSAGATLICVEQKSWRDAAKWMDLIKEYQITIWNSVPTLFKMLLIEAEAKNIVFSSLRYVLLSGDWIDLDIPDRLQKLSATAKVMAMGGATEAAIWSNYLFVQGSVPKEWVSIPYGQPLSGQYYRIVDSNMQDCPDYAVGELWIGGVGVAKGYLGDDALTFEKFVEEHGCCWYRTGDIGRFWEDDTIEFLGRKDKQVKIRGHRIELGEIEAAFSKVHGVEKAIVSVTDSFEQKKLVAYLKNLCDTDSPGRVTIHATYKKELFKSLMNTEFQYDELQLERMIWQRAQNDAFALEVMRQWLNRIDMSKVSKEFQPLVELWLTRVSQYSSKQVVSEDGLLKAYIEPFDRNIAKLVSGEFGASDIVLDKQFISVEEILSSGEKGGLIHSLLIKTLQEVKRNATATLRILEIGTSRPNETKAYMDIFEGDHYTIADDSIFYLNRVDRDPRFEEMPCRFLSLNEMNYEIQPEFDLIIANQTIHRSINVSIALTNIQRMLKNEGILVAVEPTVVEMLAEISTIFLKKDYTDLRAGTNQMVYEQSQWEELVESSGFRLYFYKDIPDEAGFCLFVSQNIVNHTLLDEDWLREQLRLHVPFYMVPEYFVTVDEFPVTENGKLDRSLLPKLCNKKSENLKQQESLTEYERTLLNIWEDILGAKVSKRDNYFSLGGDSLLATVLRNSIQASFQIEFSLEVIFTHPILADMAAYIEKRPKKIAAPTETIWRMHDDKINEPFPLTEMQQSYLIGRSGAFDLGHVSSHCYFEMETEDIETVRMEKAWNRLIQIHPMMRAVICGDNLNQRILEETEPYRIAVIDLRSQTKEHKRQYLLQLREKLSNQVFNPYEWPAYDIRYVRLDEGHGQLLISFDNLFFDGWSMFQIFRQWKDLYFNQDTPINTGDISFREYVLSLQRIKQTENYQRDIKYWKQKLPVIYKAPELNVIPNESASSNFVRYQRKLDAKRWNFLRQIIKKQEMTEPAFLMSIYAEVLARYSKHQKFSINLTRFNRLPLSKDINKVVGDFTMLTILSLDMTKGDTFEERAHALQKTLWCDLEHSNVSGVIVERMMNKANKSEVTMPVVFTSGLGINQDVHSEVQPYLGQIGYGLSQTPQVWLDMQVYDDATGLSVSLDAVEGIFPVGMVAEMFQCFESLLLRFTEDEFLWNCDKTSFIRNSNENLIKTLNNTKKKLPQGTLIDLYQSGLEQYPDNTAVIQADKKLTYRALSEQVRRMSDALLEAGVKRQTPVAILLRKGIGQIISALGIMQVGAIYLPLSIDHPWKRNRCILKDAGVEIIICEQDEIIPESYEDSFTPLSLSDIEARSSPVQEAVLNAEVKPVDIAYVIYTSGTTGRPKGVAIEHRSAVNTILEINQLIGTEETDKVLALSQLNFDLSVYDIFGLLGCGGTIVLPEHDKAIEPEEWNSLVLREGITIWNSVPSLLNMYITYLQGHTEGDLPICRILLSGDWIPVDIKQQVNRSLGDCTIYGLGGATEASIWSNWYLISEEDKNRKSIPYGRPLANQSMYVLNDVLGDVPNNVPGDLYIGGVGLANCYWNDAERTAQSFIYHEEKQIRLYRTGDMAMYSPEGFLIFLGREDGQVKINGYRVEIGEIESVLMRITGIKECAVVFDYQLHAFVVTDPKINKDIIDAEVQIALPTYMHPQFIHFLNAIPVTANGKIDRNTLIKMCSLEENEKQEVKPETEIEKGLALIWERILEQYTIYLHDDFFVLGGDSLKAVQVTNEIKKEIHLELSLREIFDNATLYKLSQHVEFLIGGQIEGEI